MVVFDFEPDRERISRVGFFGCDRVVYRVGRLLPSYGCVSVLLSSARNDKPESVPSQLSGDDLPPQCARKEFKLRVGAMEEDGQLLVKSEKVLCGSYQHCVPWGYELNFGRPIQTNLRMAQWWVVDACG